MNRFRLLLLFLALILGCATSGQWIKVRDTPSNPLAGPLQLLSPRGAKPTPRTEQLLRRFNLLDELSGDRSALIARLEQIQAREPNPEHEYAMAELAYLAAKRSEATNHDKALEFYGSALVHAYRYLFDDANTLEPNHYDPQFRGASDLYNQSLEGMLRIVQRRGQLLPGITLRIETVNHVCTIDFEVRSNEWHNADFERFEFVSDYEIEGLRNHYRAFGLGVPLIAVRSSHSGQLPAEEYYPSRLSFPVTAFLRASSDLPQPVSRGELKLVLELFDPLEQPTVKIDGRTVPLETDLSTPLAYFLNQPELSDTDIGTLGLLFPDRVEQLRGLYMLEPFDPQKMPVIMVHGLWSSPLTWMEMFNDLRSDPLVRENYQFWFYLYPTGKPFWISAAQMRGDLVAVRDRIDPDRQLPALDQTILIGHSMGGLVSRLQSIDSGNEFWRTISDRPISELETDDELRQSLESMFYFQPNPSIRRVVSIGTPYHGSRFANGATRWIGSKLIALPKRMIHFQQQLLARNRAMFRPGAPLDIETSIDSLAADSPLLPVLLSADPGPWVAYHNIIGHDAHAGWREFIVGEGDGIVSLESATLPVGHPLRSQVIVPADHMAVHQHPQSILEVRRVLLEQLAELRRFPYGIQVASAEVDVVQPIENQPTATLNSSRARLQRLPRVAERY